MHEISPDDRPIRGANLDDDVVAGFGDEWSRFDQSALSHEELLQIFGQYFALFPWDEITSESVGFDLGCGSGRWARLVAARVGHLECIDASVDALNVARRNLIDIPNAGFQVGSAGSLDLDPESFDFGYSLGVLHHTPDPLRGLTDAVRALKQDAPMLIYLYYALDNRPRWFRMIWRMSDSPRRVISRLPLRARYMASQMIAFAVYWPLSRFARLVEMTGFDPDPVPLSMYRNRSMYVMRNDALDRFGTRIEHRFTRQEIKDLMSASGLRSVEVSDQPPYWCAIGYKR